MGVRALLIVITAMVITQDKLDSSFLNEDCGESVGLLTTYRCNLNCKYCYIRKKRNKDMTLEMAQSILEPFLLRNGGMLNIAFMGGETLLSINMIRTLVEWIENRKWNRKYRFFGSTNGTLLSEDLKIWLKQHRDSFTLGLSYDGLPTAQINNRSPIAIDIDFFIKTWPKQPIQMTINTETVAQMADGVIYLLNKGATVHPNVAFEECEWPMDKVIEYGKQLNKLIYYYKRHKERPLISQFVHNLKEYADNIDSNIKQTEICGAGNGFQVFDIDGESYPCHMLSPLVLEGNKLQDVKNGLISNATDFSDENCLTCPYKTACPTCMACNYLYRNSIRKRDRTHCLIMKMEVKAYIKMEVERLKHVNSLSPKDAMIVDSIVKLVNYNRNNPYPILPNSLS